MDQQLVEKVSQSFGRCLGKPNFMDDFYDIFLKSSSRIAPMFANTDFEKQKAILRSTISYVIMHAKDENAAYAKTKLEQVGDIHSRGKINVDPSLYPFWVNSLVAAVKKNDDQFSPELEDAWKQVVTPALDMLKAKY